MKLYAILIVCALVIPAGISAQYDHFSYEQGRFHPDMSVFVFAESTSLKVSPAIDASDRILLNHGDRVTILVNTMVVSERRGIKQYWYQVEHTSDSGKVTSGFIPGHDIALGAVTFQIDYRRDLLLFQITDFNPSEAYTLTAKIVRNGKIVKMLECPFIDFHLNPPFPDYSVAVAKNIQTRIDDKSEVAEIAFFHAKSEYPAGNLHLIWNGENLDRICETVYLKEPGLFEYDSWVVYPGREGVKPGHIMMVEVIKEFNEDAEEYMVTERITTLYKWDGESITVVE